MKAKRAIKCAALLALLGVMMIVSGCVDPVYESPEAAAGRQACGGADCHDVKVERIAQSAHYTLGCQGCHEGTGEEHANDPENVDATVDFRVASCGECHQAIAATYLYDDNLKVGPFGGSQREPREAKVKTFPRYNEIVAGHGFTRDYDEEGAHKYALEDHYKTLRGKSEVCLQCKSTEVSWAWIRDRELKVSQDTTVTLYHTETAVAPAKSLVVPEGTTVRFSTNFETYEVESQATLPDGTVYSSPPGPSDDATATFNWIWASTMAATWDTMPYGVSCVQCHDPHTTELRLLRAALVEAVKDGSVDGEGGVNPYASEIVTDVAEASLTDRRVLQCAQCHVEYAGGRSAVDGIVRDVFSWSKAADLHEYYGEHFDYQQDWRHAVIGEPLIKSQHPEVELFWNSTHYTAGVACMNCHMPQVRTKEGEVVRSHWFTSPYKYQNERVFNRFATQAGLDTGFADRPCQRCHLDRTARGIEMQREVYARQKIVQDLVADSAARLGEVRKAGDRADAAKAEQALEAHRKAHVLWENLIISENSMGFHNYEEVMSSMDTAEQYAREAISLANEALP